MLYKSLLLLLDLGKQLVIFFYSYKIINAKGIYKIDSSASRNQDHWRLRLD